MWQWSGLGLILYPVSVHGYFVALLLWQYTFLYRIVELHKNAFQILGS